MITFNRTIFNRARRWRTLKRRARRATMRHALRALFYLNREAYERKGSTFSTKVYAVKSALLRHWHEAGLVESVTKQKQTLMCSYCGGDGNDPYSYSDGDEACRKCDGSGIYRITTLYLFRIDGYAWHTPAPLCAWLNSATVPWDAQTDWSPRQDMRFTFDSAPLLEHWYAVCVAYLVRQGVDTVPFEWGRWRDCLHFHVPGWWRVLRRRLREYEARAFHLDDLPF